MAMDFLDIGPKDARATLLLAHGAGAPMDSPGMTAIAGSLAAVGLRVIRFEFAYMADRRREGGRKPPPRADKLIPEFCAALNAIEASGSVIIGGKSMGGRVASMMADEHLDAGRIAGLLCVGYPFHPPNKPETLRTKHLRELRTPTLICQGTRDPFGTAEEVANYDMSPMIEICWFQDGDHDLKPRKRISGLTLDDHMATMAQTVSAWIDRATR